jgi:hypothetical protein
MANPSYKVELILFLLYTNTQNITLRKTVVLPFIPFEKLCLQLSTDEEDESSFVFVEHVEYNTILNSITVYCDEIDYNDKENAEEGSLYYINTLGFTRTK